MDAGIHAIGAEAYHLDPCPDASLSSSIARTLLARSPAHARAEHPRLNPDYEHETRQEFDLGSAAHAFMLGDPRRFTIIDAENYRTSAAKEARDAAYAAGGIPLLAAQHAEVLVMVAAGKAQIAAHREAAHAFGPSGTAELTLIWRERNGVWCRARPDWRLDSGAEHFDYKTTGASAEPDAWTRYLFAEGLDVQAAFYSRGERAITGRAPVFRFVAQENKPPYALSILQLLPAALAEAEEKVEEAIDLWGWCLKRDRWPGYLAEICHVERPGWNRVQHEERKARNEMARKDGGAMADHWLHWQAP